MLEEGKFYFIKDSFFNMFKEYKFMINKENGNKRPCYFCFKDKEYEDIIWFVPISSKVKKYKLIYDKKRKTRKKVLNFVFGEVLGKEKVFLIQNMFPTKKEFIIEKYQNKGIDVEVKNKLKVEIIKMASEVINMAKNGKCIPFYDIIEMRNRLIHKELTYN